MNPANWNTKLIALFAKSQNLRSFFRALFSLIEPSVLIVANLPDSSATFAQLLMAFGGRKKKPSPTTNNAILEPANFDSKTGIFAPLKIAFTAGQSCATKKLFNRPRSLCYDVSASFHYDNSQLECKCGRISWTIIKASTNGEKNFADETLERK